MNYAQYLRPNATIVQIDLRTALECSDFAAASELPSRVATKKHLNGCGWCYPPSPPLTQIPGHIDYHDSMDPLCQQTNREDLGAMVVKKILVPSLFD
jgi:hypothetical protein